MVPRIPRKRIRHFDQLPLVRLRTEVPRGNSEKVRPDERSGTGLSTTSDQKVRNPCTFVGLLALRSTPPWLQG